jgi:NAD(P)H-flavin reductase
MAYAMNDQDSYQEEHIALLRGEVDRESNHRLETHLLALSTSMNFLIRPYDSFTSRLRDAAASRPAASLRVLVEGPYGHTHPFHNFHSVLFLVGGSGIVVPLTHIESLVRSSSQTRSVRIVWAVRETGFATEVLQADFRKTLDSEKVSIDIYFTQDNDETGDQLRTWPKEVRVLYGRPDIGEEVEYAAQSVDSGSLAVVACGPAKLADDSRRSVVDMLRRGYSRVEYFEESFKW